VLVPSSSLPGARKAEKSFCLDKITEKNQSTEYFQCTGIALLLQEHH